MKDLTFTEKQIQDRFYHHPSLIEKIVLLESDDEKTKFFEELQSDIKFNSLCLSTKENGICIIPKLSGESKLYIHVNELLIQKTYDPYSHLVRSEKFFGLLKFNEIKNTMQHVRYDFENTFELSHENSERTEYIAIYGISSLLNSPDCLYDALGRVSKKVKRNFDYCAPTWKSDTVEGKYYFDDNSIGDTLTLYAGINMFQHYINNEETYLRYNLELKLKTETRIPASLIVHSDGFEDNEELFYSSGNIEKIAATTIKFINFGNQKNDCNTKNSPTS